MTWRCSSMLSALTWRPNWRPSGQVVHCGRSTIQSKHDSSNVLFGEHQHRGPWWSMPVGCNRRKDHSETCRMRQSSFDWVCLMTPHDTISTTAWLFSTVGDKALQKALKKAPLPEVTIILEAPLRVSLSLVLDLTESRRQRNVSFKASISGVSTFFPPREWT